MINSNTAMRVKGFHKINIPGTLQTICCRSNRAKVTTLLLSSKRYLRDHEDQCSALMAFADVNSITNMTHGVNRRRMPIFLRSRPMNTSTSFVSYSCGCSQTRSQLGAREAGGGSHPAPSATLVPAGVRFVSRHMNIVSRRVSVGITSPGLHRFFRITSARAFTRATSSRIINNFGK
jgi:hypothetical protein